MISCSVCFNYTAATEIYTLSLHDALPISPGPRRPPPPRRRRPPPPPRQRDARVARGDGAARAREPGRVLRGAGDRKSTRLNSSHANISYAVFCLKKKTTSRTENTLNHRRG